MTDEDGFSRYVLKHRIIASVFCPRKPGNDFVRHLDDDRMNCRASNLAWGTRFDNTVDAISNGRLRSGEAHNAAFLTDDQVREIYLSREATPVVAKKYNISGPYVSNIRRGSARRSATQYLGAAPGAVGMGGYNRGRGRALTKEQAIEIYTSDEPHSVLARKLGVSMTHVLRIRQGAKWSSVTEGLPQPVYRQSVAGIRVNADGSFQGKSITGEQAAEIYTSPERGRDIAQRFNITEALVSSIRKGCQWRHVTKDLTQPVRKNYRKHRKLSQDLHPLG